jgi:ATP-dependent helicase/nuclease subunit B
MSVLEEAPVDRVPVQTFDLEHENQIQLRGRIDRLDTCVDENRVYVKVIDYKSGNTKFDLLKLYYGMQLQLIVYMNAAVELEKKKQAHREVVPGGLFYYHIDDPVVEVTGEVDEAEIQAAILKELKPDGLVNAEEAVYRAMDDVFEKKSDVIPVELKKNGEHSAYSSVASTEEFEILSEYVNHRIVETGNHIYEGNVEVSPFVDGKTSSCDYCPYKAVCGFELKVKGFKERKQRKIDKKDLFDRMATQNAVDKGTARRN